MKISTKGRYALRLMVDLAQCGEHSCVPIRAIAKRQNISEKYLEQIITSLNRAGLVKSIRGAGGGYALTRGVDAYTVGEILRATEGSLAPVSCVEEGGCCDRMEYCVTAIVWEQIFDAVNDVVNHITLGDLLKRQTSIDEKRAQDGAQEAE